MLLSKEAEYAQVARDLQDLAEYQTLRLEQVKQLIGINLSKQLTAIVLTFMEPK